MAELVIGLLHPGEMGAALGSLLVEGGREVLWASSGRGLETARRAKQAGLRDVRTVGELTRESGLIVSVCPPHAALDVAKSVAGARFDGVFVDANAISPASAREIATVVEGGGGRYVDGGILGAPPSAGAWTRLYLSGREAAFVADLFEGTNAVARIVSNEPGAASAVKMVYAAWTKGTAAMLLAIRALARAEDVEPALLEAWGESIPELEQQSLRAARSAARKGWRWDAEMEEIASTFAAAGLPAGFHEAAAEVFRRSPRLAAVENVDATLEWVLLGIANPAAGDR